MGRAEDRHRKSAQSAKDIEEVNRASCHSRYRRGAPMDISVKIAAGAEVLARSLQHSAHDLAALLRGKPSDRSLHVTRHLHTECIEVRRVIKFEQHHAIGHAESHELSRGSR